MQRVRITDKGLQANFGSDILTIDRGISPVMGDSFGYSYRGSIVNASDFIHGPDFNTTGKFMFNGRDPVDLFIDGMDRLLQTNLSQDETKGVVDFPEQDQHFYEYTLDPYTRVAAIGVSSTVVREKIEEIYPETDETDRLFEITRTLIDALAKVLAKEDEDPAKESHDRPDVASYAYPLGIREDDTVVLFAEQSNDSLRLILDNSISQRTRIPTFSMQRLADWMRANFNDSGLKRKSIWG